MIRQLIPTLNPVSLILIAIFLFILISPWRQQHYLTNLRRAILWVAGAQLVFYLAASGQQFLAWRGSPVGHFLLPPHSTYWYEQINLTLNTLVINWLIAGVVFLLLEWLTKKGRNYLDQTDIMLVMLGTVAVGWPALFIFYGIMFILTIIWTIIRLFIKKQRLIDSIPLTNFIIPAVIITLLYQDQLLRITKLLKISF